VFLRRRLGEQKNEASWTPHFFRLTLFSLFLSFSKHFSSNMASPRLALPRLRRRLKGKKGVNRHASPYRLKNYGCQFRHRQPCRPCRCRCSPCRRSLAFLCRGNLGLLPVVHARGDRAPRLSFRHGALVGGYYVGKGLSQTSCCSSV
jgi:hypothetical protein